METTERSKALVELLGEIDLIDAEAFLPNQAVEPTEDVIGAVEPYERKLYALSQMYRREHGLAMVDDLFARHDKQGRSENSPKLLRFHQYSAVLSGLFWMLVSERLALFADGKSHGVRDDWKIVAFDDPGPAGLQRGISGILGLPT
jgi:hypothetical protein